jgi:hypothetical protein
LKVKGKLFVFCAKTHLGLPQPYQPLNMAGRLTTF